MAAVHAPRRLAVEPFADSNAHLLAELERIDLLIRSRVASLRRVQTEDEHFRGLYISEAEVDAMLSRPVGAPPWLKAVEGDRLASADEALQALGADIASRRAASLRAGVELRLDRLATAFGLDAFEESALLVCLAAEIDLRFEKLFAYLQDDVTRKRPSVDLVLHLLSADPVEARRHFLPGAPLRAKRLVELREDPAQPDPPLLARVLRPNDRVVSFLLGHDEPEAALRGVVAIVPPGRGLDSLLLDDAEREALRHAAAMATTVLLLQAAVGGGRCSVAAALAAGRGQPLVVVDTAAWAARDDSPAAASGTASRWMLLAELVDREAALRGAAVHWRHVDALSDETHRGAKAVLLRAIDAMAARCSVAQGGSPDDVDATAAFPRRGAVRLSLAGPDHGKRTAAWRAALARLPCEPGLELGGVADRFRLSFGRIEDAAAFAGRLARLREGDGAAVGIRDLQDACRAHSNQRLSALARKTSPHHRWEDIVLPDDRLAMLREICNQVKYREQVYGQWGFGRKLALGKGLAVLFAGPSGTGKTMAAGVIASELSLDLYKIDLSTVISKYIGETEKNLGRIFDEAESSNAILFFDEADALFGKRSEVRDSHDRYANIEVGYLLQRMEQYEGIAILATNFRKNMDDAFVRRLHFTLEFPYPDEADRLRIWQGIWPADTPREDSLDLELLARRYEMTGGNIKNVAVAAAFLAADDGQRVGLRHVQQATLREYQKTGKLMSDGD